MKAFLDCIPCVLQQGLRTVRLTTDDEQVHRRVVVALLAELATADLTATPMELGQIVQRIVGKIADCSDPYAAIKKDSNAQALKLYPRLRDIVAAADDPLRTATQIAIAGNILDFGIPHLKIDIEATLGRVLQSPFAIDDYELFTQHLAQVSNVLYLADNAGEIVFDRVLIEQMLSKSVVVAVKSEPFINDATREDAEAAGLTDQVPVIEVPIYPDTSPQFEEAWANAELIISKGQANYEAYSEADGPLFFLLLAKCDFVAQDIGVNKGDMILQSRY